MNSTQFLSCSVIINIAGTVVRRFTNDSWIRFDDFNFGSGASTITVSAASGSIGGTIEVRAGSSIGPIIGSVVLANTGGWNSYQSFSTDFANIVSGVEDLYFVIKGGSGILMKIASFQVDFQVNPGDLGIEFAAADFNTESHPLDDNIINIVGTVVRKFKNDSWIRFDDFDFGSGASSITVSAASGSVGGTVEVRTGSSTGPIIGSVVIANTGGWNSYQSFSTNFGNVVSGVDDLYFVTKGGGGGGGGGGFLMKIASFQID